MSAVAIVGVECGWEGFGAVAFAWVGGCVGPELEQGADESFGLAVGLRAVGAGLLGLDAVFLAGVVPAAFEAGAVVGQDALDADAVAGVEAGQGLEEGER